MHDSPECTSVYHARARGMSKNRNSAPSIPGYKINTKKFIGMLDLSQKCVGGSAVEIFSF